MLDAIRQNAQSWGVKLAFAIIIIVFVFWGVGSMGPSANSAVLATVNEKPIMVPEFQKAYEQQVAILRQQVPGLQTEDLRNVGLGRQVLQQMIAKTLVLQEAERVGITVTPQELKKTIASISVFRNEQGVFDGDLYQRILAAQGITPGQFEEEYRQDILVQKMQEYVGLPASVTTEEARAAFEYAGERRSVDFAVLSAVSFIDTASVSPEEIRAYYDQNAAQFMDPARVTMDYVLISPASLAHAASVTDADVDAYYADRAESEFTQEETVHARHILVLVDADAPAEKVAEAKKKIDAVLARARAGEDFGALAKKYSEGPSAPAGGDLGSFGRGAMVKSFEDAAFALKPGQVSDVVRTEFGFHVIKLESATPRHVRPLAEVRDEIRRMLAEDRATDKVSDTLDVVFGEVMGGKTLASVAKEQQLILSSSAELTRAQARNLVGLKEKSVDLLFNSPAGTVVDTPLEVDGGYLVAEVTSSKPEGTMDFEKVSGVIQSRLLQEAALRLAGEQAKTIAPDVQAGNMPKDLSATVQTTPLFGRNGVIPGLGQVPELEEAAFSLTDGSWAGPFPVPAGAAFIRLKDTSKPGEADWKSAEQQVKDSMLRAKRQELFRDFVNGLVSSGAVEIHNEEFLSKI